MGFKGNIKYENIICTCKSHWLLYNQCSNCASNLFLNVLTEGDFCVCEGSAFHWLTTLLLKKFLRKSRRAFGTCTFSVGVEEPSSSMCVVLRVGCDIRSLAGVNHVLGLTSSIPFRILNDWIISPRWRLSARVVSPTCLSFSSYEP